MDMAWVPASLALSCPDTSWKAALVVRLLEVYTDIFQQVVPAQDVFKLVSLGTEQGTLTVGSGNLQLLSMNYLGFACVLRGILGQDKHRLALRLLLVCWGCVCKSLPGRPPVDL